MRRLVPLLLAVLAVSGAGYEEREVRAAAVEGGFADIADRVATASRPGVTLRRTLLAREPQALGTSRLGGRPDMPRGSSWPQCAGRPQHFLGQVRLRDLPAGAESLSRHGGVLLFFAHVRLTTWEGEPYRVDAGRCVAVIHARGSLVRTGPPAGPLALRPARLRFTIRPSLPDIGDDFAHLSGPLADVALTERRRDQWGLLHNKVAGFPIPGHQMLGYLGYINGGNICSARGHRRSATWHRLFTLGYDERLGWEVADSGRLEFLISPRALRAGRFSGVCAVFDSG